MSLATRCTACGTVFRVVQDQLKVSEGWVRCGRCDEVFNALEGLFDLGRDAPAEGFSESRLPIHGLEALAGVPPESYGAQAQDDPSLIDKIDAQLLGPHRREDGSTPATRISERDRLEFPDARFDPELLADDEAMAPDPGFMAEALDADEPASSAHLHAPEFVRRAQRRARWESRGMRVALAATTIALLAVLGLQVGHQFRDLLAARWPVAKPAFAAWCGLMSCTIGEPRRIEDVFVESSSLTRASAPESYKLSVALRNRGSMTVALPSVELSLTDPAGQLMSRRVLGPRDFRVVSALLSSGGETALQLVLTTGSARVTGYTVEVFYP